MEQRGTGLKTADFAEANYGPHPSPIYTGEKFEQRKLDQIIFDEAIEIACDWLEASDGRPITKQEFDNLFINGYASQSADDVENIFYDWDDYHAVSSSYYIPPESKSEHELELADTLRHEAGSGLLPVELFLRSESYAVDNPNNPSRNLVRHRLTDAYASPGVIIERYYKYQVAQHILKDKVDADEVSEERIINIALGFTMSSGKPLSSLSGSLKNSDSTLTDDQIERACEQLGIYNEIYPKARSSHLEALIKAAEPKPFNTGYSSSFPAELMSFEADEVYYDLAHTKLVVGKVAVDSALAAKQSQIYPLVDLLTDDEVKFESRADKHRFKEWTKQDCLAYGGWLLKILQVNRRLSYFNLERASRLQLGPGINGLSSRFDDDLDNFYSELGVSKKYTRDSYKKFSSQDMLDHVRLVAERNEGKISERLLREYYQEKKEEGIKVPSPAIIQRVCGAQIGEILEEAGFKVKRKVDAEACVIGALRFYDENGRLPRVADIIETPYLHSWPTIRRYCGSISGLTELAQRKLADRAANQQTLAA